MPALMQAFQRQSLHLLRTFLPITEHGSALLDTSLLVLIFLHVYLALFERLRLKNAFAYKH
jgi:hypothetical protein